MIKPNEKDVLKLLEKKHTDDIFVHHCKNGPTWGKRSGNIEGLLIMDAWVMKKSWFNPRIIGYEIKVNRQDFLNDNKWKLYMNYCNVFYFVCPPNLIQSSELPKEVGLFYTSVNIKRLYLKKQSDYREIEEPSWIYKYILICRSKIMEPV